MKYLLFFTIFLMACGTFKGDPGDRGTDGGVGPRGDPGVNGEIGPQGMPGIDALPCSVIKEGQVVSIMCPDNTKVTFNCKEKGE